MECMEDLEVEVDMEVMGRVKRERDGEGKVEVSLGKLRGGKGRLGD